MTDLNTFGGGFKAFRKSKKMTGDAIGAILRVKKTHIAMIEKNATKTPAQRLMDLATAFLDLDLTWLLTGKGEMLLDPGHEKLKALVQSEQEELQATKQELQGTIQEIQSLKQELQTVRQELQAEQLELRSVRQELEEATQRLHEEQERVRAVREKLDRARNKSEALEELLMKNQIAIPKNRGAST